MNILIQPANYTFVPASRTITFNAATAFGIRRPLLVENLTRGLTLYRRDGIADIGGSWSNPTLTFSTNTAAQSESDDLIVYCEDFNNPLGSVDTAFRAVDTFSRPADTIAYLAGDVIGAAGASGGNRSIVLSGSPAGSTIQIGSAQVRMSGTAIPSGMNGGMRLYLYTALPANVADNAAFTTASGERSYYIDYIDIPVLELIGGNFLSRTVTFPGIQIKLASGSNTLFYELTTASGNAMTPTSAATFDVLIRGVVLGA